MVPLLRLALFATAVAVAFLPTEAFASDGETGPAMGHSTDPDDLVVESEDPDDMVGRSEDSDDLVVESEDPDDMVGRSEDSDDLLVESEDPDALVGDSQDLADLPEDSGRENLPDPMPQLVPEPPAPGPNDGPTVHAAWRAVQAAERNMEASNDIYSNMIDTNYPRGERRERIIEERRAAFEEVNQARQRYNKLRGE
jgi:hypothetical protein